MEQFPVSLNLYQTHPLSEKFLFHDEEKNTSVLNSLRIKKKDNLT